MPEQSAVPSAQPRSAVILLAAGEGRRVGADTNKALLPLAGIPVFAWSLRWLEDLPYVDEVVVVIRVQDRPSVEAALTETTRHVTIVTGGATRHGSEWQALQTIADRIDEGAIDVVAIHDSARPLADTSLFQKVLDVAYEHGGALPTRVQDALVRKDDDSLHGSLASVQTPQAFRARPLLDAYRQAERDGFVGTDTASCVERYTDLEIHCVPSPATNLKITFPEDVTLAERLLHKLGRI